MANVDLNATHDLAQHDDLDENGLNDALKLRFEHDMIYTYVGDILLAINPYKRLDLYSEASSRRYHHLESKADHPPHLFAIADAAYAQMRRNNKPQVRTECHSYRVCGHSVDTLFRTFYHCYHDVGGGYLWRIRRRKNVQHKAVYSPGVGGKCPGSWLQSSRCNRGCYTCTATELACFGKANY
eukprot:TRINITY_DN5909_c0_g1_i2.p1 TRINITY_DN5909_c0_g1~~TRINITY_DN5909_c0_g1_i2.p1  ORF type:complete len:183 (+),score=27.65 TRINITY_DN5909_c0_g1_i2:60-608(+)